MYLFERKVTGYRKQSRGLGCEDATAIYNGGDVCFMACADGHGDPKCKYAARGAELAASIAVKELRSASEGYESLRELGQWLNEERESLMKRLVCSWVEAVLEDYRLKHPEDVVFAERYEDLVRYSREIYSVREGNVSVKEFRELAKYRHNCDSAIYPITLLYGTTLNAAVITDKFVFAIGIGDGDVVAVNGRRVEWLLPRSTRYATGTDSLCRNFGEILERYSAILVPVNRGNKLKDSAFIPEFVMISTDGLRNAFLSDEDFADKLLEISSVWKNGKGNRFVRCSKEWIEERSRYGVMQDDISFCFCTRYEDKKKESKC